jgi:CRISPR/Cas system CSM-associated protein Csm2 small subunit
MDSAKTPVQFDEMRVDSSQDEFLAYLGELNALHARITRNEGEVAAKLDEVEKFLEVRMTQVRILRDSIREDQKNMRRVEAKLFQTTKMRLAVSQSS